MVFRWELRSKESVFQSASKVFFVSLDPSFHWIADGLTGMWRGRMPDRHGLIVIDEADDARIYVDGDLPVHLEVMAAKAVAAGDPVLDGDILDVRRVKFGESENTISIAHTDKFIFLFRHKYLFGLYLNLSGAVDVETLPALLADIVKRTMHYELFQMVEGDGLDALIETGWFPFLGLGKNEIRVLSQLVDERRIDDADAFVGKLFDEETVNGLVERWQRKKPFADKQLQLEQGIAAFNRGDYAAAQCTLVPLVEGIADLSHRLENRGKALSTKKNKVVQHIIKQGEKSMGLGSMGFPEQFERYLRRFYYQDTDQSQDQDAVRNPLTHGRSSSDSFTRDRALQTILTLDQIYFFL